VAASLATGFGTAGEAGGDVFSGIEGFVGSAFGDVLTGDAGSNSIYALAGDDVLRGGGGADRLYGGGGADTFIYIALSDSTTAAAGQVFDFSLSEADRIDLSAIDANSATGANEAFTLVGAFSSQAGQATLTYDAGLNVTNLRLDANGDGVADFLLAINGHLTTSDGLLL
jgi:Ca2+-binding RTX toxin-like protein